METERDPIAACATPPGTGAVGVVRLSGAGSFAIAERIAGPMPPARVAALRSFRDPEGNPIDTGLVIRFVGPHSFTGEDLVEFQGHGSPVAIEHLIENLKRLGVRQARPGEFSERAFLNGRMDLAQAEAIADLIAAESRAAAAAAMRTLTGHFSEAIRELEAALDSLRVGVEAEIDFADEDVSGPGEPSLTDRLAVPARKARALLDRAREGMALRRGCVVVLAGPVNAGKSTLFNRFLGEPRAIVTPVPGTTRDWLEADWVLDGLRVHVIDTAGFRESEDPVEQEGMRRARSVMARAHLILYVIDDALGFLEADEIRFARLPEEAVTWKLYNQIDRTGRLPGKVDTDAYAISAETEAGLAELKQAIRDFGLPETQSAGDVVLARARHLDALERCSEALENAQGAACRGEGLDCIAEGLRQARLALGEILGQQTTEELLGAIFSTFCIGK